MSFVLSKAQRTVRRWSFTGSYMQWRGSGTNNAAHVVKEEETPARQSRQCGEDQSFVGIKKSHKLDL